MMRGGMRMGMMSSMTQEQGMMHMAGGELMHRTMQLQPGRVLDDREQLELSAEQVSELEQLETARRAAHQEAMATARAGWEKVREAFDASAADPDAVRMAAAEAFGAQVAMHMQMITDAANVQGILTAEQREKVVEGPCGMHMRMQDGMGGHGGSPDDQ
jgi:Spy/CpxP family protein refolding chaperone